MLLHGPAGCGKTFAVLWAALQSRSRPWWHRMDRLADKWRRIACGEEHNAYGVQVSAEWFLSSCSSARLAVIDDIGAYRTTPTACEALYSVLEARVGKRLIVTSNLPPAKLSQFYDDRIVSRLTAGMVVHVEGSDLRLRR